jgi:hypothetical protein
LAVNLGDRDCEYFCIILLDLCVARGYVEHWRFAAGKCRSSVAALNIKERL